MLAEEREHARQEVEQLHGISKADPDGFHGTCGTKFPQTAKGIQSRLGAF